VGTIVRGRNKEQGLKFPIPEEDGCRCIILTIGQEAVLKLGAEKEMKDIATNKNKRKIKIKKTTRKNESEESLLGNSILRPFSR